MNHCKHVRLAIGSIKLSGSVTAGTPSSAVLILIISILLVTYLLFIVYSASIPVTIPSDEANYNDLSGYRSICFLLMT